MPKKKAFFARPTPAQIRRITSNQSIERAVAPADLDSARAQDLLEDMVNTADDRSLLLDGSIIPDDDYFNARNFIKYGPVVELRMLGTRPSHQRSKADAPDALRQEAFDNIDHPFHSGYAWKPAEGDDLVVRKVPLVDCVEGAQVFAYGVQSETPRSDRLRMRNYTTKGNVSVNGGTFSVHVPSRSDGQETHEIYLSSVAIVDDPHKYTVQNALRTSHHCGKKLNYIRLGSETNIDRTDEVLFDAHDIAGYFYVIQQMRKKPREERTDQPLVMNPFAVPTEETVAFYRRLNERVLIKDEAGKYRHLNQGEREILLWSWVQHKGYENTFHAIRKVESFNWTGHLAA